jgi:hypothetical protein
MSSLIASASPWNSDNDNNTTRKRIPTMRKTVKLRPYAGDIISQADVSETVESMATIEDTESANDIRSTRVADLINQMANVSPDNDGQGLADFKPPPMPENHYRKDMPLHLPSDRDDSSIHIQKPITNPFINEKHLGNGGSLNSYHAAYETQPNLQPYYAKQGLGKIPDTNSSIYDGRIAEKINYMIHLLEGQEAEKTANVTEEFILYTFLGVFIIYICDSFSRGGRYIR